MNSGNDTVSILAEQLDRLLGQEIDTKTLAAAEAGESVELAGKLDALGLPFAMVCEEAGGAGLGWAAIEDIFQTAGYHATPLPLCEHILANGFLDRAGMTVPEAPALLAEDSLKLEADGTVSGSCVVTGRGSSALVAEAVSAGAGRLCLLDISLAAPSQLETISRDPRVHLTFERTMPIASSKQGIVPGSILSGLAVARSAQIAGALSRILEMSIDYGNTRVQFGRPIGKFQAVQHMIAELAAEAAAAKAAVQLASRAMDVGKGWEAAAIAKVRASMAAGKGAMLAHEVHGAIGVTEEHMLHYFTRRLWQWRDDAGSEHIWAERLGRAVLSAGGAAMWPGLVGLSAPSFGELEGKA